ncbi:hypothetical protein BN1708_002062 [Verticillium longisporum]|uniref:Pseudouridine synthase I TruA alpha/beta domain-containing protein n=2 Tax=Verticillium longisporum TaxID=100787 RepID=A0A0G4KGY5_VERLO|nr:hypothetical protein BN1708_002062 [Verticillium longisporum]
MSNNVRYDTWDKERLICRVRQLEMEIRHRDAAAKKAVALTHSAPSTPGGDSSSAAAAPPPAKKRKKGAANIDPSRYSYRYVALRLAYLGKNYNGFEHQQSAVQATIESELWSALTKACLIFPPGEDIDQIDFNYKELDYSKCGRTDKGVSAFGQVIGLRLRSSKPLPKTAAQLEEEARKKAEALQEKQKQQQHDGQGDVSMQDAAVKQQQQPPSPPPAPKPWDPIKDELPYCKTLNRLLPPDIRILAWCPSTPEGFSARFSCTERQYRYYFTQPAFAPAPEGITPPKGPSQPRKKKDAAPPPPPRPKVGYLDIDAMRAAAKKFEGLHDFRNFCKVDGGKQLTNFMRRMFEADIVEVDDVASAVPYLSGAAFAQPETAAAAAAHGGGRGGSGGGVTPKVYYLHVRGSAFLWHQIRHMKFEGLHDFRNFCKVDGGKQLTNFMRRMFEADIVEVDDVASAVPHLSGAAFAQPETAAAADGGSSGGGVTPKVYYLHVRGSAFLWHQIRHMVSVLFLVGQGLERPEVVDELLDVARHPRKPNYGLAHEVPLVLWDCIFPTDRSVPEGQQADGMAWVWEAGENKHGAGGLVDVLWAGWREKKMDELLANRLLDLVSLQGCPEANPAQNVKWNVLQKVYVGGNEGRLAGEHLPLMKRKVVPSPMEINDRWAQRMGYGSSEELLKEENWRVSLAKDRRARREGGSGGGVTPKVYYLHVRGSAFLWHQIRHMVSVLFLVGQGLERPEVVDELLDVERHPRKPNYGLAHEVPLVLWDCIFPTDRSVPEGQQADGMAWEWEAGENKYGAGGLVDVLWAGWREKKMDELLANRLLDLVSLQGCPEANPAQNVKWNVLQKVYAGGNEGRLAGEHLPLMKRKVVPSPMEINDRWAQRMGYGSDDLTVQVIFFGNGRKTGEVVANLEATAPEEPVKAKL